MKQLQATNDLHLNHVNNKWDGAPEQWLSKLVNHCLNILEIKDEDISTHIGNGIKIHISNTRGERNRAVGKCYHAMCSPEGYREIEVDREYGPQDTWRVINTVFHEVCHAITEDEEGHGREFFRLMTDVFGCSKGPKGMEWTKPLYTKVTQSLFRQFVEVNGLYPHAGLLYRKPKQSTRMVKCACLNIDCAGATNKSIDQGYGTIFRMSSAAILLAEERGKKLTCPVCEGKTWNDTLTVGSYN